MMGPAEMREAVATSEMTAAEMPPAKMASTEVAATKMPPAVTAATKMATTSTVATATSERRARQCGNKNQSGDCDT
jgi:hypothetical protein